MFGLLERFPGVAVLHDFFLSGAQFFREIHGLSADVWLRELYAGHGYAAVRERFHTPDIKDVIFKYPCNLSVIQQAIGVIVHSAYSVRLAREWYSNELAEGWSVIPLLRIPLKQKDCAEARHKIGFSADDVVVCSFGILNLTKQNHRLLNAWLTSALARDKRCKLVFVGENNGGDYSVKLQEAIRRSGLQDRITITGWVDNEGFRRYLAAADIAVQLRTLSRGETSAAMLDCMNYGLPTIVNANGAAAELPSDAVWMLPDDFTDRELIEALETLRQNGETRAAVGARAREVIRTRHDPRACAEQYAEAIEKFYTRAHNNVRALIQVIAALEGHQPDEAECIALSQSIAQNFPLRQPTRRLFIDVSATRRDDLKTGIERVARALLMALVDNPPVGFRVEPVYLTEEGNLWHYRYARQYTFELLGCVNNSIRDEPIEAQPRDVMLCLDLSGTMVAEAESRGVYRHLKEIGVDLNFVVHDLLPIKMPEVFPPGASDGFAAWLGAVCRAASGVICVSRCVADDLIDWVEAHGPQLSRLLKVAWSHNGADLEKSVATSGMPENAAHLLGQLAGGVSFLMVGTIEPRKGYLQAIEAFTQLWEKGVEVNLVIVGSEGWKDLPFEMRRTIPQIVERLYNHDELGRRLFWLGGISDEFLEKVYGVSTCLIAASEGEGFGLPLIEAAQHGIPIIARDIPVFREIAGECAFYFRGTESPVLACAIRNWLALFESGRHPKSNALPRFTWQQSADSLMKVIVEDNWYWKFGESSSTGQLTSDIDSKGNMDGRKLRVCNN
jgi:glycosyltransferase involved in cell wall biosynthesis